MYTNKFVCKYVQIFIHILIFDINTVLYILLMQKYIKIHISTEGWVEIDIVSQRLVLKLSTGLKGHKSSLFIIMVSSLSTVD